jgi:hypothetical protein
LVIQVRDDESPPSLDTVFVEVKDRMVVQLDQADALDRKAGTLLAFSSVVLTVAAGLRFGAVDDNNVAKGAFLASFVLGVTLYAVTMFFAFRAYAVVRYRRDPEPRPLRDLYLFEEPSYTKRRIIANLIESFDHNAEILRAKAYDVRMASRYLFLETLTLAVAVAFERVLD